MEALIITPAPFIANTGDYPAALVQFIALLQARQDAHDVTASYPFPTVFSLMQGPKNTRVVRSSCGSRSVYCFVAPNGDLLKPDGWKGPTKSSPVRGNLYHPTNALSGTNLYGVDYLR